MKNLIQDMHRRSLWQVLGVYGVASWVVLQVVDVLAQNMGLPPWVFPFALVLLLLGLPVVLATAFVQSGVGAAHLDEADSRSGPPLGGSAVRSLLTWRNALTGGVLAFALLGVVSLAWLAIGESGSGVSAAAPGASSGDLRSIAVLPFTTRAPSGDEEALIFSEGMHDDVLTQLAKIDSLVVISRTSVMQYANTTKTIGQIAGELGVATVLEGGVDRAGDRVRINVQLIRADTDQHLWAETYDEELTAANIFAIRSDLSVQIAQALHATLTPETERRLGQRPTESLEAYDLLIRGRHRRDGTGDFGDNLRAAGRFFERAIEIDPGFAPAYAELALTTHGLWNRGYVSREEALPQIRPAVERALELDPFLAVAHSAKGQLLRSEREMEAAEAAFRRAIELDPGSAAMHARLGGLLVDMGRFAEAATSFSRSVQLDPFGLLARANLAFTYAFSRNFPAAERAARALVEIEPEYGYGHYVLAIAFSFSGQHEAAIAEVERALEIEPGDVYNQVALPFVHARAGNEAEALRFLAELEASAADRTPWAEVALVHAQLGDLDAAMEYLERAYQTDPANLRLIAVDPSSDPLRQDPRFLAFLERLVQD